MASDELAVKLQRRLDIKDEQPGSEPDSGCEQGAEEKPVTAAADNELSAKLLRRGELNEGSSEPQQPSLRVFNPHTEFKEFSRKQIRDMEGMFRRYDAGKDGFIDLMELKLMMEKLEAPQTHLGLKNMIKEVDEDFDGKLSFRELMAISDANRFEQEIKEEQEEKKKQAEQKKQKQAAFRELQSAFK
ncbi:hypothetical protein scyTo_0011183 [Scyliorhinus torazame]|uniref:EF-hand domain-containing protein n=1 Tax=Scyliorhinus torazame TaxID=75743 RepID=A0A401NIK7_SCYTO|nr:hypothetical protein [Scyliorhinus torazame]